MKVDDMLQILEPQLNRSHADTRQVVVMTCGISGQSRPQNILTVADAEAWPSSTINHIRSDSLVLVGSGKSTLSKAIVATHPSFKRLSYDAIIYATHGMYAVDYPPENYQEYQEMASKKCDEQLLEMLKAKTNDIMLDLSFHSKAVRMEVKKLVESNGARWVLVYLNANEDTLWRRIEARRSMPTRDADSAFNVTKEVLRAYIEGWEPPDGEGEVVISVA